MILSSSLAFALSYTGALLLPGWLLTRIIRIPFDTLLLSVSLSYAIVVLNLLAVSYLQLEYFFFFWLEVAWLAVLAAIALRLRVGGDKNQGARSFDAMLNGQQVPFAGMAIALLGTSLYLLTAGIYTDLPADVWRHLEYINNRYDNLDGRVLQIDKAPWHTFLAILWKSSGMDAQSFIQINGWLTSLLCIALVYTIAGAILRDSDLRGWRPVLVGLLAVYFFIVQKGVGPFSYFRYYTFGPTIISLAVFYCWSLLLQRWLHRRADLLVAGAVLAWLAGTLFLSHKQEALFALAMALLLPLIALGHYYYSTSSGSRGKLVNQRWFWFGLCAWLAFLAFFLHAYFTREPKLVGNTVEPWIVPVERFIPSLKLLYIANPGFQVFQVISAWGILVIAVLLGYRKILIRHAVLLAGLLSPVVTLFNPLFVATFVRYYTPDGLYRMAYMVPLEFGGALAAMLLIQRWRRTRLPIRIFATAGLLVLILLPLYPRYEDFLHSRIASLKPVAAENSYQHWQDLVEALQGEQQTQRILTDPVTAYLLRSLTKHSVPGWKFVKHKNYPLDPRVFKRRAFNRYTHWLIVTNLRSGGGSETGRLSGHWPEDILQLQQFYSPALIAGLQKHPMRFKILWRQNGITVYCIAGRQTKNRCPTLTNNGAPPRS